jgi:hypothetical protein
MTTPGDGKIGPPPDAVVGRYDLENKFVTPDGQPDEGTVTIYENSTRVTDASQLGFAPTFVAIFSLLIIDGETGKPVEPNTNTVKLLRAKATAVFDKRNEVQGPYVGDAPRPFPMENHLRKTDEALRSKEKLSAHTLDTAPWDSVLSGASDPGRVGATLGFYTIGNRFGVPERFVLAVQSSVGAQPVAEFRKWVSDRIASSEGLTYGELASSRQYQELLYLSKRNAHRLVIELLADMGMASAVDYVTDQYAVGSADGDEVPSPLISDNNVVAAVHSDVLVSSGKGTVGFYSKTVPFSTVQNTLITVLHPAQGLAYFVGNNSSRACFRAATESPAHPLTPKRAGDVKYKEEVILSAYYDDGSEHLTDFVKSRNFEGKDARTLAPTPGGCSGEWRFLEPVAVIID